MLILVLFAASFEHPFFDGFPRCCLDRLFSVFFRVRGRGFFGTLPEPPFLMFN